MTSKKTATPSGAMVQMIAVDQISILAGFNPRKFRDPETFRQTVASVARSGVLQALLVTPTEPGADTYRVVDGEGRLLAAREAKLTEVPCRVTEVDERTGGRELALASNLVRDQMDPVSIAQGFADQIRDGWSKRQVATFFDVSQKLVTERLLIVGLPEDLHPLIADGSIPPSAIRTLADLAAAHPQLPGVLTARVLHGKPADWPEPPTWAEAIGDPIEILTLSCTGPGVELPDDVYVPGEQYVIADLELTDDGRNDLEWIAEARGIDASQATGHFAQQAIDQALALGVAYPAKPAGRHLILGKDYGGQIMSDGLRAMAVKIREEQAAKQEREAAAEQAAAGGEGAAADDTRREEDEAAAAAKAQREAEKEARRRARIHNDELGAEVARRLAKVKVDPATLKLLLLSVPLHDAARLAMRGARYGLPGWERQEEVNGKAKRVYIGYGECVTKVRDYLDGASTVGEIAGRALSLLAMARYADEVAVASSYRSRWEVRQMPEGPWGVDVVDLIDQLCEGRLPEHLTAAARQATTEARKEEAEHDAAVTAARDRVDATETPLDGLDSDALRQLREDVGLALPSHEQWRWHDEIRTILGHRAEQEAAAKQADVEASSEAAAA